MPRQHTYAPAWWVPGAHLRTLYGRLTRPLRRRRGHPALTAERWVTPDDDILELRRMRAPGDTPADRHLVLLHGLEGGMHSHYVANFFDEAAAHGWSADLIIFRGCNGEANRARRFYHSGETSDLAFALERIIAEAPDRDVVLAGVSLGGNVLLKYLGERGEGVPARVRAAAAMSVPFDLARGCRHISRGFSRVYERHFLRSLKAKAQAKLARYPDLIADATALERVQTLWDFDDVVTAPVHGFADAEDYYRRSSSIRYLEDIRVPTLLLSAEDDPFLPREVLDEVRDIAREVPALRVEFVKRGGHVGFVSGWRPWKAVNWGEWRIVNFLAATAAAFLLLVGAACTPAVQPIALPAPASAPAVGDAVAPDSAARALLADVREMEPTIVVEARYATANNFTGAPLPGYEANRVLLRREAAVALARAQRRAMQQGYALKVFDGYRPVRATLAMVDWTERVGRQDLIRDGYIAARSRHNLGLAIDLTLVTRSDSAEVDMGTPYDTFSEAAHTANASGAIQQNRALLVRLLEAEGFTNYDKEWWHFSYEVPNPLRFDIVIR